MKNTDDICTIAPIKPLRALILAKKYLPEHCTARIINWYSAVKMLLALFLGNFRHTKHFGDNIHQYSG